MNIIKLPLWICLTVATATKSYASDLSVPSIEQRQHISLLSKPSLNKHPEHIFDFSIEKDPAFRVEVYIDFTTGNIACGAITLGTLIESGQKEQRHLSDGYVIPSGVARDSLRIPLDRYKSGKCDWYPSGIRAYIFKTGVPGYGTLFEQIITNDGDKNSMNAVNCQRRNTGNSTSLQCWPARQGQNRYLSRDGGSYALSVKLLGN